VVDIICRLSDQLIVQALASQDIFLSFIFIALMSFAGTGSQRSTKRN